MLIACNVGAADLRVHASLCKANFWSFAQFRAASARRVSSVDSQSRVRAQRVDFMTLDDVRVGSTPCHVIGSIE